MDNDNFTSLKVRGSQILGLRKLLVQGIETEGIKLKSQEFNEAPPTAQNLVSWIRPSTGEIVSDLWSRATSHSSSFLIETLSNNITKALEGYAKLLLVSQTNGGTRSLIEALVKGPNGTKSQLVIDDQGNSGFCKYVGTNDRTASSGSVLVKWSVKSAVSDWKVVPHSIGKVPAVLTEKMGEDGGIRNTEVRNKTTESFEVRVRFATFEAPAGAETQVDWIAIG